MTARVQLDRPADSPWHTREEAAHRARVGPDQIGDALRSGELRGYQSGKGGRWRIHRDDIDAWITGEIADVQVPKITRRRAS
jgi:excisionase family DNA binding protein